MLRIILLSALAALSLAQRSIDPKTASILQEDRYLSVNGQFGAAYKQEDGVEFKEESDADGTRRGSYSYVDPTGQRRTVSYVAGKNGFQPTGDHIPAAPVPVVNPLPQYNPPPQAPQQYAPAPAPQQPQWSGAPREEDGQWIDDTKVEYPPNSIANAAYPSAVQSSWNANPAPQRSWAPQPAPQQAPQQTWSAPAPAPQQASWSAPAPSPAPQRWSAPIEPTPAPHRFFPPGHLNLNRSPDGFSFSFQKS